jgi:hypothetical protein
MGRPRPDGGTSGGDQNTSWGGAGRNVKLKSSGFPKGKANDYDAQRGVNERTMHYGPVKTSVTQAKGPYKGESAVNP